MRIVVVFVCALLAVAPSVASAQSCTVTNAAGVVFGSYDVFDPSATQSTGSVTYECSGVGELDSVIIELGAGNAGGYDPRTLTSATDVLSYNLYLDAALTSIWGDGTGGTSTYGPVAPPESSPETVTAYGNAPAGQDAAAGSYTDTIVVTLQF